MTVNAYGTFELVQTAGRKRKCCIPQRYVLGIMGFLAIVMAYAMRVCLNIAIVDMTSRKKIISPSGDTIETDPEFDWSSQLQGIIKSSFYIGYILTHIPGGLLSEKFGGKHTLGLGIFSTALFTLVTPQAIYLGGAPLLLTLRIVEGLGEGTTYPALNTLLSKWVPANERGKIGSLAFAGSQIGTVLGTLLGGLILQYYSWPPVFYFFGAFGIVWWLLWNILCYSDPESHPFISNEELKYLQDELGSNNSGPSKLPPVFTLLTSVPLWALIFAQIGHDWGFFTMVTDLPKFMDDVIGLNIGANGIVSSIPMFAMWLTSIFFGWLCDFLIIHECLGVTTARKLFTTAAATGPAIFLVLASYVHGETIAVVFFTIGMGLMGAFYPGMKVNALDLAPNYAGTLMAIVNGIGAITGVITPYVTSAITVEKTAEEWRTVFWISFTIFVSTNIVFVLFGSGETQWWNDYDVDPATVKQEQNNRAYRKKSIESVC